MFLCFFKVELSDIYIYIFEDLKKLFPATKDVHDEDAVADILGISSILVQDLKERRNRDYKFNWEKCLNFKADSGVFLQYAHARLNRFVLGIYTHKVLQLNCFFVFFFA